MGLQEGRLKEGRGRQRKEMRKEVQKGFSRLEEEKEVSPDSSGQHGRRLVPSRVPPVKLDDTENSLRSEAATSNGTAAHSRLDQPEGVGEDDSFHPDFLAKVAGLEQLKGLLKQGLCGRKVEDVF